MPEYPVHGSKFFDVREWVDPRTFGVLGAKSACLIDPAIIRVADLLREKAGVPVTVNNWHFAKPGDTIYKASGFRAIWEKVGGQLSQHRCGRAGDFKVKGMTPSQALRLIMAHAAEFEAAGLTTIENVDFTKTWLHADCRPRVPGWHPSTGFLIVDP